jgi:hypothetical protein
MSGIILVPFTYFPIQIHNEILQKYTFQFAAVLATFLYIIYRFPTHQLLVYADDVNILGGSVHAIKKNTEALVVASKDTGLEVNAEKTKYMVMSRDQNAGQNISIKIDNKSFERVEQFKYL